MDAKISTGKVKSAYRGDQIPLQGTWRIPTGEIAFPGREGGKGLTLHPSKGSPKRGQRVNPFRKRGTPLRPEGVTLDDLGVQRASAGAREAREAVKCTVKLLEAARKISRWFDRTTGMRRHSALSDCIARTVSLDTGKLAFMSILV